MGSQKPGVLKVNPASLGVALVVSVGLREDRRRGAGRVGRGEKKNGYKLAKTRGWRDDEVAERAQPW